MPGIFQQQVGGGDGSRSMMEGVQNDSLNTAVGYLGGQAIEANRGYNDAATENDAEAIIRDRLANYAIQRGEGKDPELSALKEEFLKYRNGVDQGAMTVSQMQIRLDSARKRAINTMPGRAREIDALVQGVTGQYKGMIDVMKSWEGSQAKAAADEAKRKETYDKKIREYMASKTAIPVEESWNPATPVESLLQKYPKEMLTAQRAEQSIRNLDLVQKFDANNKIHARQEFGNVISGTVATLPNVALNIAASITGKRVTDISSLSSSEKAAVADGLDMWYAQTKGKVAGPIIQKGYTDADTEFDSTVGQGVKALKQYLSGETVRTQFETDTAIVQAKATNQMLNKPGVAQANALLDMFKGTDVQLPTGIKMDFEKVMTAGVDFSAPTVNSYQIQDSEQAQLGIQFLGTVGTAQLNSEQREKVNTVVDNFALHLNEITDPRVYQNLVVTLANPKMAETVKSRKDAVASIVETTAKGLTMSAYRFLQDNGMRLNSDGSLSGGTTASRSTFVTSFIPTINALDELNQTVQSPVYQQMREILGAEPENNQQQ